MRPIRQDRDNVATSTASRRVHVAVDGVAAPLSRARAQRVVETVLRAEHVGRALISVAFLTSRDIASLNRRHLGVAGPTDVISFGFNRPSKTDPVVGDIYIAPDVAKDNAVAAGVSLREELVRLVVHGTLHVLGYDHPNDRRRERSAMWKRQEALVRRSLAAGLPR
jgi:probable rRNA maturation factor